MRIAIIGRTEVLYETAEILRDNGHEIVVVITAKEAPEYTKTSDDFKMLADQLGVPFIHTPRIEEAQELIDGLDGVDIGVSMNYSGVIPESFISNFPLGVLNAHAGDLPRYRGNACQAWAIINGEDKIGLCIHSMIGGELDSGDIIARSYMPIDLTTKVGDVWKWFDGEIPKLFLEAVENLAKDENYVLEVQSKDPSDALRCYPRMPEDGQIDWSQDSVSVQRLINASNKPYAGAFCDYKGDKLIVWDSEIVEDDEVFVAVPGQVTLIGDSYIEVACGGEPQSKIRLKSVDLPSFTGSPNEVIKSIRARLK